MNEIAKVKKSQAKTVDRNESGLSVSDWCNQNGVNIKCITTYPSILLMCIGSMKLLKNSKNLTNPLDKTEKV
jgi:hypothetical protein